MRAIKIDPVSRRVTEINLTQNPNETLQELYDIIGCDLVQPVQLDRGIVMVIVLGGSAHEFKALKENLASFEMLTEWVAPEDVPGPEMKVYAF